MQVNQSELNSILRAVKKIEVGTVTKVNRLNTLRAKEFKRQTISSTKRGKLGLATNTEATVKIQGIEHEPEYFTGALLNAMEIKETDETIVEAGYFADDKRKPKGSKITFSLIAMIQTTGYRIPLSGAKGKRVRGFLASKGIFPSKDREFLVVKPRPFLFKSYETKEVNENDVKEINKYMSRLWKSL